MASENDDHADCVFCGIAAGRIPAHIIWSDEQHLAFLSIFPNTEGFTVVIPKEHHPSYVFELPDAIYEDLLRAARTVGRLLDRAFDDVDRTAMIFEGFGVNHVHAKLVPLHGTVSDAWQERASSLETYFDSYPGYVSSHDSRRAEDEALAKLAARIRATDEKRT